MSTVSIASPSRYDACGADLLYFCRFPAGRLALAAEMRSWRGLAPRRLAAC